MEEWRDIKGYEGLYQISNHGNVVSKERRVINHRNGTTRIVREAVMNPWDNGNGYLVVTLRNKRHRKNVYVHRLVAEAFIKKQEGKSYINHKDYDKHNNAVSNLEWCTQKENIAYSNSHLMKPKSKCRPSNTGEKYISKRISNGKHVRYRVNIRQMAIDKCFETFEEAIQYRNEVMKKWQNQ
jgi:hypothetical protein